LKNNRFFGQKPRNTVAKKRCSAALANVIDELSSAALAHVNEKSPLTEKR